MAEHIETYRNFTYNKFLEALNAKDISSIIDETDPNQCWAKLLALIIEVADVLCPIIELRVRVNTAEYLNKEVIELLHDRDYFVKKRILLKIPAIDLYQTA